MRAPKAHVFQNKIWNSCNYLQGNEGNLDPSHLSFLHANSLPRGGKEPTGNPLLTFKTVEEAIALANDTAYGLGAGVWTRSGNTAYRLGRAIEAGRVWTNCYHQYPAHAAFGGYKASGFGRENHRMMLDHYQQTKNLLISYDEHALGLF